MIYNNPVAYAVDVTPEMFVDLADEPSVVAIKESSENVRRITDLVNLTATVARCSAAWMIWCSKPFCSAPKAGWRAS
jgi:dihydrodipicolinate synthase/N-acetylneuraminate lyase